MLKPIDVLREYWGYDQFRPTQEEVIQSVLDGKDTLALLPTGGGKSICFQVPALCQKGICLVVSPLIALMKDQVNQLRSRGIDAQAIYSGMHFRDIDRILDNCIYGQTRFLYLSPERLKTELVRERVQKMAVNLIAVDEAHCISQWGYDFRPPYLEIAEIRELHPKVPVLALTATATPMVVEDIQGKLEFQSSNVLQQSFRRENLSYVVLNEENKLEKLIDILSKVQGSGIVYVRNRRKTKEVALHLQRRQISAEYYHAGLSPERRGQRQDAWMNNELRVIVATNAFGMGIDKSDVRIVVHLDLPDSLEAYFQEAGRAGRDRKKAYAVLLYNDSDRQKLERQHTLSYPELSEVRRIYRALGSYFQLAIGSGEGESFDFNIVDFTNNYSLELVPTFNALRLLEKEGWVSLSESVYIPSTIQILTDKESLYDFQLRNRQYDLLIKTILRTYQGAFLNPVPIRESQLASFLKIPQIRLRRLFEQLQTQEILKYIPQKDQPQLTFLRERVDADNLNFDQKQYAFRRKQHQERIQHAIRYATATVCRSQQLLAYFGEKETTPCGICDVCLGRNKTELSNEEFQRFREKILRLLKHEDLMVDDIVDSFSPRHKNRVLRALEFMLEEGTLAEIDGKMALPRS